MPVFATPMCSVCWGWVSHAPDCPERYDPEEPREEEPEMPDTTVQLHTDGQQPQIQVHPYTGFEAGKGWIDLSWGNIHVIVHGLAVKDLQEIARLIAGCAHRLASLNEEQAARDRQPVEVPFEFFGGKDPHDDGPPVEGYQHDLGNPVG